MRNERRDQSGITAVVAAAPAPTRGRATGRAASRGPTGRPRPRWPPRPRPCSGPPADRPRGATKPDDPEGDERGGRDRVAASRDEPEAGPDEQRHGHDEQLERELVVGPEEGDDDVLRPGRLEVDDDLADGGDERCRAREEARQQLGDAERGGGGHDPRRPPPASRGGCWRTSAGSCWTRCRSRCSPGHHRRSV